MGPTKRWSNHTKFLAPKTSQVWNQRCSAPPHLSLPLYTHKSPINIFPFFSFFLFFHFSHFNCYFLFPFFFFLRREREGEKKASPLLFLYLLLTVHPFNKLILKKSEKNKLNIILFWVPPLLCCSSASFSLSLLRPSKQLRFAIGKALFFLSRFVLLFDLWNADGFHQLITRFFLFSWILILNLFSFRVWFFIRVFWGFFPCDLLCLGENCCGCYWASVSLNWVCGFFLRVSVFDSFWAYVFFFWLFDFRVYCSLFVFPLMRLFVSKDFNWWLV